MKKTRGQADSQSHLFGANGGAGDLRLAGFEAALSVLKLARI